MARAADLIPKLVAALVLVATICVAAWFILGVWGTVDTTIGAAL